LGATRGSANRLEAETPHPMTTMANAVEKNLRPDVMLMLLLKIMAADKLYHEKIDAALFSFGATPVADFREGCLTDQTLEE
jgi:hypothetical protein